MATPPDDAGRAASRIFRLRRSERGHQGPVQRDVAAQVHDLDQALDWCVLWHNKAQTLPVILQFSFHVEQ